MNQNKKNREEALEKSYQLFLSIFLENGPVDRLESIVDKNVMGYGTAKSEKIHSIEGVRSAILAQREQIEGIKYNLKHFPIHKIMLAEFAASYVSEFLYKMFLPDGEVVLDIRISTFWEWEKDCWKLKHWHSSLPTASGDEQDVMHLRQWKKEALVLQEKVDRQTRDLLKKNRELEVEAALERVRSRAMAMQHSDELAEVTQEFFEQMTGLGMEVFRSWIDIIREEEGFIQTWTTDLAGQFQATPTIFPLGKNDEVAQFLEDFKSPSRFIELEVHGEGVRDWIDVLYKTSSNPIFLVSDYPDDLYQVWAKHKYGTVATTKVTAFTEGEREVLARFAQVFEQAYRRFLDLEKAESQAREAQIEAALERVRAQTMAMHSSEDVGKCISSMFSELTRLGVPKTSRFGIGILNQENIRMELWTASKNEKDEMILDVGFLDMDRHPLLINVRNAWLDQLPIHTYILEGKDLRDYFQALEEAPEYTFNINIYNISDPNYHYDFPFNHGIVYAFTHHPLENDFINIFKRFSALFEQTYQRYLDLKKAEGQAREAKIEAALERVRSKSMAMQHSEDLADLSLELVKQVQSLGIETWFCAFNIQDDEGGVEWGSNGQGVFPRYRTPREGIFFEYYQAGQAGESLLVREISEEECPGHYEYLCRLPGVGDQLLKMKEAGLSFPSYQIDHVAFFKYGYILFITFEAVPESHNTFIRFAKTFEQSYTRFLDLQKAEAQAREAQIEVAVERVRAKALAMHDSSQIMEVVSTLHQEVLGLEIPGVAAATIYLPDENERIRMWDLSTVEKKENGFQLSLDVVFDLDSTHPDLFIRRIWKNTEPFFIERQDRSDMKVTLDWLSQHDPEKAGEVRSFLQSIEWKYLYHPTIQLNKGKMSLDILDEEVSEEVSAILAKMGAAFDLAYKRFKDLEIAEYQVREAKIEAALEKVRSRSMAMQSSDELPEVANVLFLQVQSLGIPAWSAGYNILSEDKKVSTCIMSSEGQIQAAFQLPLTEEKSFKEWHKAALMENDFFIQELGGKQLEEHYEFLMTLPDIQGSLEPLEKAGLSLPTFQVNHLSFFTHGFLLFITYEKVPDAHDIFKRFTYVFEQTYSRFLDLQRAEIQTKKIEAINRENERLLHSILPAKIAEQIRNGHQRVVKRFEEVSILFADIVGFTILSEKLSPDDVVDILNGLFSRFDDLTDQYGLEKIKTIGDAYMVAAGVPNLKEDHAHTMFQFAQDMLIALKEFNLENKVDLSLRIGISSGPVVAGVIGKKKFAYDLWGDTVNTAARMEAYGKEGRIQVSPSCFEILKTDYDFEKIANVPIKGKGMMDVYVW